MGNLAELMQSYADLKSLNRLDGTCATHIPGVRFYRGCKGNKRQPLLYQSGIIVVGQGTKQVYLGEQSVRYGPGDYLVLGVPLPLECEAFADGDLPLLGLSINVAPKTLHSLVNQLNSEVFDSTGVETDILQRSSLYGGDKADLDLGIKSECINDSLNATFMRLLKVLHNDVEAKILGPAIVEEIVYRILIGRNGHILFDLARHDSHYARIAKILSRLHRDYADPITVESLAEQANMSLSGFHKAFRQVTTETPLQYLKKVRLNKAKEMIVNEGKRSNDVATLVGYASASQFSREFKRHFNATPRSLIGSQSVPLSTTPTNQPNPL